MENSFSSKLRARRPAQPGLKGLRPAVSGRPGTKNQSRETSEGGWTLVELMITVALITVVGTVMTALYAKVSQGMASDEMHTELQQGNQAMLNRIRIRLGGSHHFLFADSSGVSYLSRITLTSAPATVVGMALSQPQTGLSGSSGTTLSLSPAFAGFNKTYVGNALLFGAYDIPQTLSYPPGVTPPGSPTPGTPSNLRIYTNVPMTVSGGAVTDSSGSATTAVIDLYRFYLYYLTASNTRQLRDGTAYSLIEWQSIQLADYHEIADYNQDGVLQGNILAGLKAQGVTVAWDPTQADPSVAFVTFSSAAFGTASGGVTALSANYNIPMETYTNVTKTPSGILTTGFRYGISPNANNWRVCPIQVPLFAPVTTVGLAFPNGFEVAAGNNPSARQIMIRSAWVAEGASSPKIGAVYNDINMVDEISDNW